MIRHETSKRPNWQVLVEQDGLVWHTSEGRAYWGEGIYYSFTRSEIERIEEASNDLYKLFIRAGDALVNDKKGWLDRFGIPAYVQDAIRKEWHKEPPALNYGRFDFGFDGKGVPKLFEFNCDTPTSLLEASVIQWKWKEALFPDKDQFNSIHEHLVEKWKSLRPYFPSHHMHFANAQEMSGEDMVTVAYLRDTAHEAGFDTTPILMDDIGLDKHNRFIDMKDYPIQTIFKLYPWEWMVNEEYGKHVINNLDVTTWIEPIWKMLWSNKAILPILWTLEPENPYLLPATYVRPTSGDYVEKPYLSREGANISIHKGGKKVANSFGDYGEEGFIYQDFYALPEFDGKYPIIGSWMVDGTSCGMGIREDGLIAGNLATFVPHIIED